MNEEHLPPQPEFKKYIGERSYGANNYKPYGKPFNDMCGNCENYYRMLHSKGLTRQPFMPKCKRHVTEEYKDLVLEDFESQEEYDEFLINSDPIAWAYNKFGWTARWYQEELLSCTASKKIIRAGRRSGKSLAVCILTLWKSFTNSNYTTLVIAPFQSQVTKLFDEMHKLINSNPEMAGAIKRSTKNPHRIELYNGSMIKGFSSGAQSSSKSDKIRGEDAKSIVLDEADYLADSDLEAILAILASHHDCNLWASSTPKGTHNKFFQWATDKDLGFKEFHFISAESPDWTEDAEAFFRGNFEATAYEHEFLAEFGLQEAGVFRNDLIDFSLAEYVLPQPRTDSRSRVVMGVDWNGHKNGVHIVVVEWWGGKYKVLAKEIVRDADFTQHAAVFKIMEVDKKYECDYIYVDEGYGRVQVEMLHKIGMQAPSTGYHKRVKPYAFNKPIEIRDPRTMELVRKPSKPFMVQTCAIQLEQGRLVLPMSEDTQVLNKSMDGQEANKSSGLVQQMRNFAVERVSSLGLPTYTGGDDHTLFAFMLAIVGFVLEFSDLTKANYSNTLLTTSFSLGKPVTPKTEDQKNESMASVIRQLDAGYISPAFGSISTIISAKSASDSIRKAISRGEKGAIRKYFDTRQINRGSKIQRKPNRGSF